MTLLFLLRLRLILAMQLADNGLLLLSCSLLHFNNKYFQYGASAIMVSNHGGRQLDGVQASIDALPEITDMVNRIDPSVEVYMDGGVRTGVTFIARGARALCFTAQSRHAQL